MQPGLCSLLDEPRGSDHMLEHQKGSFFRTSFETGITQELADKVISHLLVSEIKKTSVQA